MLHHHQGIAEIGEAAQGFQQLLVIPLMQPNAGFVQYIEHPHKSGTDLGGQADTLGFAAGKGARGTGKGQVFQTNVLEEFQARVDLNKNLLANHLFCLCELHL